MFWVLLSGGQDKLRFVTPYLPSSTKWIVGVLPNEELSVTYKLSIFFSPPSEACKPGLPFRNSGITFPSQVFPIKLDLDKVIDTNCTLGWSPNFLPAAKPQGKSKAHQEKHKPEPGSVFAFLPELGHFRWGLHPLTKSPGPDEI